MLTTCNSFFAHRTKEACQYPKAALYQLLLFSTWHPTCCLAQSFCGMGLTQIFLQTFFGKFQTRLQIAILRFARQNQGSFLLRCTQVFFQLNFAFLASASVKSIFMSAIFSSLYHNQEDSLLRVFIRINVQIGVEYIFLHLKKMWHFLESVVL